MKRRASSGIRRAFFLVALSASILTGSSAEARDIFVAKNGSDTNAGDAAHPLLTIQHAADVAYPGDTITVHAGVYRERVDPPRGGTSETQRIIYRAAPGEDVRIVGSEHVLVQWAHEGADWRATLPKGFFGSLNPFATLVRNPSFVHGDKNDGWGWLRYGRWAHLGDVYINGQGLTEQETDAGLSKPLTWHADVDSNGATTIKANFGALDANTDWVEVNVRPTLFYPSTPGLSYLTVRGFTMMNAATHWTPPTVEQLGAIGPNGGNHWIIEDDTILYSKAVGISLGVPSGPADQATSGHHIVRDNVIMRCGQAGIVGETWNSYSIITRNDIEDTNYRREFGGAETGGIKFHQAHHTVIENNFIRGVGTIDRELANGDAIWLDFGNSENTIRNNVIAGAMGNSILMEANWVGSNVIENNVVVGGRAATYSSRDTLWKYNLFFDCRGYWVNQVDLNRPPIAGAVWARNLFIRGDMAGSPDARQENLFLGEANAREGDPGEIIEPLDPHFVFNMDGAVVTATFEIDSATYHQLAGKPVEGIDFYGHPRKRAEFGFGPFANVVAGKNVMPLFRYSPRHFIAVEILKCGIEGRPSGPKMLQQTEGNKPIYQDPNAPIRDRVRDLLTRMTLEEKVAQLESGCNYPDLPGTTPPSVFDKDHLNEALAQKLLANGLGTYCFLDEFISLVDGAVPARMAAHQRNLLQHWVMANTRLGIPIMFHGEALHGAVTKGATSFPQAVALGSTWDPVLIEKMFSAVALESRALGNSLVLAPVLDLSRDPRYGRTEEMYSEDPYLVAEMGVAAVRGLQGDSERLDQNHVFATAKHFVHGQPENGTNAGPSDSSEHTMRSVFLYPFEQAVEKAHIEAVMPSYNTTLGGIPSNANPWLLKEVLRNEWGFTGITVSDYTAVSELTTLNHVARDLAAAGRLALKSGVDMELPSPAAFPTLVSAVQSGTVSEKQVNEAVERVLTAKFRAGLFEHPYVDENRATSEVGSEQRKALARQVADEAIVLLKNTDHLLPLDPAKIGTLAVIGPNADKVRIGSYAGIPPYFITALAGIQKRVGTGTKVVYAEGCRISEPDTAPNSNGYLPYKAPDESSDWKLMDDAVNAARSADVIVLVLGGNEAVSRESTGDPIFGDSDTIALPGRQNELIQRISTLRKPMVAVLLNGKAYSIEQLTNTVPAILEGWYLGQETGNAIADVLFGDVNPSGHLPVTIARNVGQLPVYYYKTPAARRGYVFDGNTPLFPFGFGLSYTTFTFGKPTVDRERISPAETAHVAVTVTNTGFCTGDEVVQMYVHHEESSIVQPVQILRSFKRIHLDPGSSVTVNFDVGPEQLSILNAGMKKVVESGPVEVWIGPNSADTSKTRLIVSE